LLLAPLCGSTDDRSATGDIDAAAIAAMERRTRSEPSQPRVIVRRTIEPIASPHEIEATRSYIR